MLLVGGELVRNSNGHPGSAEIWDPATGTFSLAGTSDIARSLHAAVLLADGRVLVVGNDIASDMTAAEILQLH